MAASPAAHSISPPSSLPSFLPFLPLSCRRCRRRILIFISPEFPPKWECKMQNARALFLGFSRSCSSPASPLLQCCCVALYNRPNFIRYRFLVSSSEWGTQIKDDGDARLFFRERALISFSGFFPMRILLRVNSKSTTTSIVLRVSMFPCIDVTFLLSRQGKGE